MCAGWCTWEWNWLTEIAVKIDKLLLIVPLLSSYIVSRILYWFLINYTWLHIYLQLYYYPRLKTAVESDRKKGLHVTHVSRSSTVMSLTLWRVWSKLCIGTGNLFLSFHWNWLILANFILCFARSLIAISLTSWNGVMFISSLNTSLMQEVCFAVFFISWFIKCFSWFSSQTLARKSCYCNRCNMQFIIVLPKFARPSLKKMSSGWEYMMLQILYIPLAVEGLDRAVQAAKSRGSNVL